MEKISIAIATFNDEENLPYVLNSVCTWANEIILADGGSADKTLEIANRYDARIFEYQGKWSYSEAKKAAIERASNENILLIDTDEIVPKYLAMELLYIAEKKIAETVFIPISTYILGEFLDTNFFTPDSDASLRFFQKSKVNISIFNDFLYINPLNETKVHHIKYRGNNGLIHFAYPNPYDYIEKFKEYYNIEANGLSVELEKFIKENLYYGVKTFKIYEKEFSGIRIIISKILHFLNADKAERNIQKKINLNKYHFIADKFIEEYKGDLFQDYSLYKSNLS
jgi:glycosyltransferase involved in cell wall biosynthesis